MLRDYLLKKNNSLANRLSDKIDLIEISLAMLDYKLERYSETSYFQIYDFNGKYVCGFLIGSMFFSMYLEGIFSNGQECSWEDAIDAILSYI